MKRRNLLLGIAGTMVAGGAAGYASLNGKPVNAFASLTAVQQQLRTLLSQVARSISQQSFQQHSSSNAVFVTSNNAWSPAQHFVHMAQSIELSVTGYPIHYSDAFKATIGSLAFQLFSSKQASTHNTEELIPGTELISNESSLLKAVERLISAINLFEQSLEVQPHFAYGELSKKEYYNAHLFHINEHWQHLSFDS